MKTVTSTLFTAGLAVLLSGCATTPPLATTEKTLTLVFDVKGVKQKELFVRANTWFVANFNSAESVIQFSDKESGKIAGKYHADLKMGGGFYGTRQMIQVDVKDEKARIVFQDPSFHYLGSIYGKVDHPRPWLDVNGKNMMDAINGEWRKLAASLDEKLKRSDTF